MASATPAQDIVGAAKKAAYAFDVFAGTKNEYNQEATGLQMNVVAADGKKFLEPRKLAKLTTMFTTVSLLLLSVQMQLLK